MAAAEVKVEGPYSQFRIKTWIIGNGKWGMGNGKWKMENGQVYIPEIG